MASASDSDLQKVLGGKKKVIKSEWLKKNKKQLSGRNSAIACPHGAGPGSHQSTVSPLSFHHFPLA